MVGASFAFLVAEELFASGCRLLLSLTSAGQILEIASPPYREACSFPGNVWFYLSNMVDPS
jgi:hypothetical protein